ncbi:thiamine-phosphate kinase [Kangiella sp. TOML190]|uniref:thiamine-phosphate kinase n=1 Tax=Kangiella sp. TOML190 TaxID=2931351 RepID=UPI00203A4DCC|nr:thiamine-phosphate kinase [Kangiella sp. TOML190]
MTEFEVIQKFFNFEQKLSKSIIQSIGDDCAVLDIPNNRQLVTSTDTLVSGVHFFADASPQQIAYKALAANVSDLLAMGAKPLAFTLAMSLPEIDPDWLKAFSQELQAQAKHYRINLIGGDTTRGALSITISVLGLVKKGRAVSRSQAQIADDIWVTGNLGAARAALKLHKKAQLNADEQQLWLALTRPQLAASFARKLAKFATAAIDVSDGLLADLGHILVQSKVGASIDVEALPLSESLINHLSLEAARQSALAGGDDYQLCFTANKKHRAKILTQTQKTQTQVTRVGIICAQGLNVLLNGEPYPITENSWQHFNRDA